LFPPIKDVPVYGLLLIPANRDDPDYYVLLLLPPNRGVYEDNNV